MDAFLTKIVSVITALLTMLGFVFCPPAPVEGVFSQTETAEKQAFDEGEFTMGTYDIVVSPFGNDSNSGSLEQPLKTIEAAKEKLKNLKCTDCGTITVWFREGTYFIDDTLVFNDEDKSDVLYRSYPDEKVVFSGAKEISGSWSETQINGVTAFVTDMPVENEDDFFRSLFKEGERLSRSNYPKDGFLKVADPKLDEAVAPEVDASYFTHSAVFYANASDMLDFSNASDVDVRIMHFWVDDLLPVHSVDPATGRIETRKPSAMTIRIEDNFVFENVKEALSLPGEWYLDRSEEKLYYIPQDGDTVDNTVLYAGLTEQLITIKNAHGISFRGINFENSGWDHAGKNGSFSGKCFDESHPLYKNIEYGATHPQAAYETPAAINIVTSSNINFTDCRFENLSYSAIKFDKAATDCNITSCRFNEIGANAVFINGDFVVPASTQNINVTDCHISNYGRIFNNAIGILLTHAINCDLSNNEIHGGWYTGISVGWNWGYSPNSTDGIKICNNLIYDIGNGWLSDMGAIYTLGIQPNTVISGNVIYNVGCDEGRYGYGGWGIYLDEGSTEILVENNLVYDCSSQCFHQHYGRDNIIRNNIFAFGGDSAFRITRHEEHNSLTLSNNILVSDDAPMYGVSTDRNWFVDDSNIYWDYTNGGNVYSGDSTKPFERLSMVTMVSRGYYNNAVFADPIFKDAANRDFTLATNSPALEAGFKPFSYNAGTKTLFID